MVPKPVGAVVELSVRVTAPPAPPIPVGEPMPPLAVMVDRLAAPEAQVMFTGAAEPPVRAPEDPAAPPLVVMAPETVTLPAELMVTVWPTLSVPLTAPVAALAPALLFFEE